MNLVKRILLLILILTAAACSSGDAYILGPVWHKDIEFVVEVRPGPPRVGMNEFIVVATHKGRKPAHEFVVSLKMQGADEWRQSIQDGHSGVYRRAIRINDPDKDVLLVQLKKGGQEDVLRFPITTPKNTSGQS